MNPTVLLAELTLPLNPEWCWLIAMSLLHSLWQGAVLAIVMAILVRSRVLFSVHSQFAIAFASLLMIGLMPVVNYCWLAGSTTRPDSVIAATKQYRTDGGLKMFLLKDLHNADVVGDGMERSTVLEVRRTEAVLSAREPVRWPVIGAACITLAYLAGLVVMLFRIGRSINRQRKLLRFCDGHDQHLRSPELVVEAARRAASSLGRILRTSITVFQGQGTALVIGFFRPVILINATLVTGLLPEQLEQILAHELAHVYRRDPLTLLIQRLVEAFLFFNPAAWYVSREVSRLRELCCDEWVAQTCSGAGFASTLLRCVSLNHGTSPSSATELAGSSGYSLAVTGNDRSQFALRIAALLNIDSGSNTRHASSWIPTTNYAKSFLAWKSVAGSLIGIAITALLLFTSTGLIPNRSPSIHAAQDVDVQTANTSTTYSNPEWPWQRVELADMDESQFLFGGKKLSLSENIPDGVEVHAMVDPAQCVFAQWEFGDGASTKVCIACEIDNQNIARLFLDSNRNRIIESGEEVSVRTPSGLTWIADLAAEVREDGKAIHSDRQIGITPNRNRDSLRITTIGYAAGTVELAGKTISVRRIDGDGNGLPVSRDDQLWLDVNSDSKFDLVSERKPVDSFLDIDGQRYAVRSDRLGQSLTLTPSTSQGQIQFVFQLADKQAVLEKLEGSLRDETGMLVPIRLGDEPITVPSGRYRVEELFLTVRDERLDIWHMTLRRGYDVGWFGVADGQTKKLNLLDSLRLSAQKSQFNDPWSGTDMHIQPFFYTSDGMVISNFIHWKPGARNELSGDSVTAQFNLSRAGEQGEPATPGRCSSSFG